MSANTADTPPLTLRSALRDWGSWLLPLVGVLVIAHVTWLTFWAGPGQSAALLSTALLLAPNALAVLLTLRTALHTSRSREGRRAWLLLAGGYA